MRSCTFSPVSSNPLSGSPTYSPAPILLDHVELQLMLYLAEQAHFHSWKANPSAPDNKLKRLPEPLAGYFANPRIYKHRGGKPLIYVGGTESLMSNGVRLIMAEFGSPVPHKRSKKDRVQKQSIANYENANNQFSDEALARLLALEGCDSYCPCLYQLDLFIARYFDARNAVIADRGIQKFNDLSRVYKNLVFSAMELYLEVPCSNKTNDELVKALKSIFRRCFGKPHTHRRAEDSTLDQENSDTLLAWKVLPKHISSDLKDTGSFTVKVYKKRNRIRIEIQAKKPALESVSGREDFKTTSIRIAHAISRCLRQLESHAWELLTQETPELQWLETLELMKERCKVLKPRLLNDQRFLDALTTIAKQGYIDMAAFKSQGLNADHLKALAIDGVGFLRREDKGVGGLSTGRYTGFRNPNYVLVADWIGRTNTPGARKLKQSSCPDCTAVAMMPDTTMKEIKRLATQLQTRLTSDPITAICGSVKGHLDQIFGYPPECPETNNPNRRVV